MMMKNSSLICESLIELISFVVRRDVNNKDVQELNDYLNYISGCTFDVNIEKWVEWYMESNADINDKEIINVAYNSYKLNLRIEKKFGKKV